MALALESKIQSDILKWLKSRKNSFSYKHEPSPTGIPDIHHVECGIGFWFEVKRTKKDKARKMQKKRIKQLKKAGQVAHVVRSLVEVKQIIYKHIVD